MIRRKQQRGVAVITALLIVALAITVSANISTDLQLEVRRTANMVSYDQSLFYVRPAEQLAMAVLIEDGKQNRFDHLQEPWAQEIPPLPLDGGQITGKITDLHSCFNINMVSPELYKGGNPNQTLDPETGEPVGVQPDEDEATTVPTSSKTAIERLKRLVSLTDIGIQPNAVDAVIDWVDSDVNNTIPGGAEDGYYLYLDPPYRTGNQTFKSISTLRLVKGFERSDQLAKLMPFVCAVDAKTDINVNTAPAEVLLSLDKEIDSRDVTAILQTRSVTPFEKIDDFLAVNSLNKKISSEDGIDVISEYFLLTSFIEIGNTRRTVYSVIYRDGTDKARVVSRTQNSL